MITSCLRPNIVYKFACGRCNATYFGETCRHFNIKDREHSGISPLTNKPSKSKKSTGAKDHMLMCDQPVSFDDFKVLAYSNPNLTKLYLRYSHVPKVQSCKLKKH